MTVLLIGSSSMIARRLRARLEPACQVVTVGRGGDAQIRVDLSSQQPLPNLIPSCEIAIHCAASFLGDDSDAAYHNEMINSAGTIRAFQVALAARAESFLYLGTIFSDSNPQNQHFGSYGRSKLHGEENASWLCQSHGLRFASLRLAQVYDEYGEARSHQRLLYQFFDAAQAGRDIVIFGRADPQRNLLFVNDVAEIVAQVIVRQDLQGVFACLHPVSHALSEVAQTALDVFGRGGQVRFDPVRPDVKTIYISDDRRLYECLGSHPSTALDAGFARVRDQLYGSVR
jgi:nucleoside-diphosphate-sugar epimerase